MESRRIDRLSWHLLWCPVLTHTCSQKARRMKFSPFFFFNFQACRQEKKKNATLDEHPSCTVRELLDRKRSFLISQLALRPHLTTKKRREKKKTSFFFFPARPYFELFLISPLSPLSPASLLFFFLHLYFCDPPYTFCRLPLSSHTD